MATYTSRSVQELIPENEKGDKRRQKYRREEDRKKKYGKNSKAKTRILQDLWPGLDVGHIHSALTTGAALQYLQSNQVPVKPSEQFGQWSPVKPCRAPELQTDLGPDWSWARATGDLAESAAKIGLDASNTLPYPNGYHDIPIHPHPRPFTKSLPDTCLVCA
jgi:hypothetical protein